MHLRPLSTLPIILFLISVSCTPSDPATSPLREIVSGSEEGWHDLTFSIRKVERSQDGSQAIHAYGLFKGREVGLIVSLGHDWKESSLGPQVPVVVFRGSVTYRSVGSPSDALLKAIDHLYGCGLRPSSMKAECTFSAISLAGEPRNLAKGETKIKLFHESKVEADYAELFTNIDLPKSVLEISEKDPEYRAAIVKALRGP